MEKLTGAPRTLRYQVGNREREEQTLKARAARTSERASINAGDYQALASFRYAVRRYLAFAEAGSQSVGLTSHQHQALLAIKAHQGERPMSIGDLAAELLVKHHSAVELVARLEKAGFADKRPDLEDRRRVHIGLTPAGEAILAALSANNLRELRLIAPAFAGLLGQLEKLKAD
jgi:DNA-binding MarR family transcriptional regulator